MNLFFWRKNRLTDKFAVTLADDVFSAIQPEAAAQYFRKTLDANKKKSIKAVTNTEQNLNGAISQIRQFKITHNLGVYGKARLHMKFMARLEELGYEPDVVKKCNEMLMLGSP